MKKVVIVFGLLSGAISSAMMFLTVPLENNGTINSHNGYVIGYTALVLSFLLVFFGIRSYRQNAGGAITFGRGFSVGILITLISCVFYVASWEVISSKFMPDFAEKYAARTIAEMREKAEPEAAIAAKKKEMEKFVEMYKNPLFKVAMTFIEPFPVGLLMTLLSAAILRKRNTTPAGGVAQAA